MSAPLFADNTVTSSSLIDRTERRQIFRPINSRECWTLPPPPWRWLEIHLRIRVLLDYERPCWTFEDLLPVLERVPGTGPGMLRKVLGWFVERGEFAAVPGGWRYRQAWEDDAA